jgi:DNA-binding CsgD family transcriptional regulator
VAADTPSRSGNVGNCDIGISAHVLAMSGSSSTNFGGLPPVRLSLSANFSASLDPPATFAQKFLASFHPYRPQGVEVMESDIIDRIYECAFVPENWPRVLGAASKISDFAGAGMFVTTPEVVAWTASRNAQEFTSNFVRDGLYWRGEMSKRIHASNHPGFLRDIDLLTDEELTTEPIRDSWRLTGVRYGAGTAFALPQKEALAIVMGRQVDMGTAHAAAIAKLDALRPHLGRAALMAARLRLERAKTVGETLAAIGLAAVVLEGNGKALAANTLIEASVGVVRWRAGDRLALKDPVADALLRDAVARTGAEAGGGSLSFPVRDVETQALNIGHVVPVRLAARDLFSRSLAVFVLAPLTAPQAPSVELVRSLFDLTPMEARVARGLAGGKTVEDLAADGGVASSTIRTHVRGVLEKTGCHRQTDFVAMIAATVLPIDKS